MSSSVGSEDEAELARALNFLAADPLYETVKPFVFRNRPADGFPVTNVKDDIATVPIRDMRSQEMTYEKNGFCWRDVPTAMTRHDYEDPDRIRDIHIPELEAYLKDFFQASQARIVNYRVSNLHEINFMESGIADSVRSIARDTQSSQSPQALVMSTSSQLIVPILVRYEPRKPS